MKANAVIVTAALVSVLLAHPALARWPPAPPPAQVPEAKRINLTTMLALDGPFHNFLGFLQKTHLVEAFERQAFLTDQGITILVPVDRAFAAVRPSALAGLSKEQLKTLMLYHSLTKHYTLPEFEALSMENPVTTFAGGHYMVNVTCDAGGVHVRSKWANANVVGSVYETVPMAVYKLDAVLLPGELFKARPPVAATPPEPAPPPPPPPAPRGPSATGTSWSAPDGEAAAAPVESSSCRLEARRVCNAVVAVVGALVLAL